MSDTNAQEPTMEEILASIRRIISEDDAPAAAPAAEAAAQPAHEPAHEAEPEPAPVHSFDEGDDDDVLELTEPVAPPPQVHAREPEPAPVHAPVAAAEALGDIEVFAREPEPAPAPRPAPAYTRPADEEPSPLQEGLSSRPTANLAASAFGQLSRTVAMPDEHRSLEDVVRELLRPMLKDWLDKNLSGIVENAVQAEVERISRLRRF